MNIAESSKGRMLASEAGHAGSIPASAAKTCTGCKTTKPVAEFHRRGTKHQAQCKLCCNRVHQEYYQDNATGRKQQISQRRERVRKIAQDYIREYLLANPCVDCGEEDIVVLEFDHQGDKEFDIGSAVAHGFSLERITREVTLKCEVVCCNCHRRRTTKQFDWWRGK